MVVYLRKCSQADIHREEIHPEERIRLEQSHLLAFQERIHLEQNHQVALHTEHNLQEQDMKQLRMDSNLEPPEALEDVQVQL